MRRTVPTRWVCARSSRGLGTAALVFVAALVVCSTATSVAGTFDIDFYSSVSATTDTDAWAVVGRAIDHWDGAGWNNVFYDRDIGILNDVAATSDSNAWAVGSRITLRWNGTAWRREAVPSEMPRGCYLSGVAATSDTNAWAVGHCWGDPDRTLIINWDGSEWSVQDSPNEGAFPSYLTAVSASSSEDAWAVGSYWDDAAQVSQTLTLHWDGTTWARQPCRSVGDEDNVLEAVVATSAGRAWAVGRYSSEGIDRALILRWNGTGWKRKLSPKVDAAGSLFGVTQTSRTNAWAVGNRGSRTLILRWNGTAWKRQDSPNEPGWEYNHLYGVAATSAEDAWAVGGYDDGWAGMPQILHWDGSEWSVYEP